jgi:hypothetical protein
MAVFDLVKLGLDQVKSRFMLVKLMQPSDFS